MRAFLVLVALLAGGSLAVAAADPSRVKGKYELWEDHEGGHVCQVVLTGDTTIGGFAFEGNEKCYGPLKLKGDPYAWFLDKDGNLVLIDATRKTLVRFEALEDGTFYATRRDNGLENLNLTPKR